MRPAISYDRHGHQIGIFSLPLSFIFSRERLEMNNLTIFDLKTVCGGQNDVGQAYISPCSIAVINFLKYHGDMLSAVLAQDSTAQSEAALMMYQNQHMAMQVCSKQDLIESGCVGPEIFLY